MIIEKPNSNKDIWDKIDEFRFSYLKYPCTYDEQKLKEYFGKFGDLLMLQVIKRFNKVYSIQFFWWYINVVIILLSFYCTKLIKMRFIWIT